MTHIAGKETIFDYVHTLEEHAHSEQLVFPQTASGIELTAGTPAWTHGSKFEIIASTGDFYDFHWANIYALSANGEYEVKIYKGGAGSEIQISTCDAVRNLVQSQEGKAPLQTQIQDPGTRISATLATSTGNADTCIIKIYGHQY